MEDEIARLYDEKPEDDVETVPRALFRMASSDGMTNIQFQLENIEGRLWEVRDALKFASNPRANLREINKSVKDALEELSRELKR